jgi:hypothetical protein
MAAAALEKEECNAMRAALGLAEEQLLGKIRTLEEIHEAGAAGEEDPVLALVESSREEWKKLGKVLDKTEKGPLVDAAHRAINASINKLLKTPPITLTGARAAIGWFVEYEKDCIPEKSGEYMKTLVRSPIFAQAASS